MVEAAPTAAFKVVKAGLLLEFLVVAFDAPAQLGKIDETGRPMSGGRLDSLSAPSRLSAIRSEAILPARACCG